MNTAEVRLGDEVARVNSCG